ncbi:MAG: ABC transporter permease [Anaerolineaceae bacterium]|nr:ABC transporter permease [Anaerolineaceae bacterium]
MLQYIFRRLLLAVPVIIGIFIVTFSLSRMIPGDPCRAMLGEKATPEVCAKFIEEQGLNDPIPVQLVNFIGKAMHGDFGESIRYSRTVSEILIERLPVTIELGAAGLLIAIIIGIPVGVLAALKRNSTFDVVIMMLANIGVSMPIYWLALMLIYLFAVVLRGTPLWIPPSGRITPGIFAVPFYEYFGWQVSPDTFSGNMAEFFSNLYIFNSIITGDWEILRDVLHHMILPAVCLATGALLTLARFTRSSMLEVINQDYIRASRAKGLRRRDVIWKHAFRNALLPVVTVVGMQLSMLFGGAVLTETVFSFAGVGGMMFEAVTARDFPVIQGFTLFIAVAFVLLNLVVDLTYGFIDPRIKME